MPELSSLMKIAYDSANWVEPGNRYITNKEKAETKKIVRKEKKKTQSFERNLLKIAEQSTQCETTETAAEIFTKLNSILTDKKYTSLKYVGFDKDMVELKYSIQTGTELPENYSQLAESYLDIIKTIQSSIHSLLPVKQQEDLNVFATKYINYT